MANSNPLISSLPALQTWPSPAKLNWFLHIVGRRLDGYHELETVFQLIDYADELRFNIRDDGLIIRGNEVPKIPADDDLCVRAARLLQKATGTHYGAEIYLETRLPIGAGLGGGSSNAATTLIALNHLWNTQLNRSQLIHLALQLGADVPFFIFGSNAFAQGIGERLSAIDLPKSCFVLIEPDVEIATADIFANPQLTRDTKPIKISGFLAWLTESAKRWNQIPDLFGRNDLENCVEHSHVKVAGALALLKQHAAHARMSGSGSSVFCVCLDEQHAQSVIAKLPSSFKAHIVKSLSRHPLYNYIIPD